MKELIDNKPISNAYESRVNFLRLMRNESDEKHKLSFADILSRYNRPRAKDLDGNHLSYGAVPTRNTLLSFLEEFHEVIVKGRTDSNGVTTKEMWYYYRPSDDELTEEETTVLIRAIGALQCIDGKQKVRLVEKLLTEKANSFRSMCTREKAGMALSQSYSAIDLGTLRVINEAIKEGKRIQFNYLKYTCDKIKVRSSGKDVYEVEPIILHIDAGFLYLVSYKAGIIENALRIYRVDRMRNVRITDEFIRKTDVDEAQLRAKAFHMYTSGDEIKVVMECAEELASSVIDKFGNFKLLSHDGSSFVFEADVFSGNTFFSWLTTFGGKIKLLEPKEEVERYKEHLAKILSGYTD